MVSMSSLFSSSSELSELTDGLGRGATARGARLGLALGVFTDCVCVCVCVCTLGGRPRRLGAGGASDSMLLSCGGGGCEGGGGICGALPKVLPKGTSEGTSEGNSEGTPSGVGCTSSKAIGIVCLRAILFSRVARPRTTDKTICARPAYSPYHCQCVLIGS